MPNEVTVNQTPVQLAPVDTSVVVPPSVKAVVDRANALHQQAYQTTAPATDTAAVSQVAAVEPNAASPQQTTTRTADQEAHHERSMEGRWKASIKQNEDMQKQMTELANELAKSQAILNARDHVSQSQIPLSTDRPNPNVKRFVTDDDMTNYGQDMLDAVKRAALEAVAPEIERLALETKNIKQQVKRTTTSTVAQSLDAEVPQWRQINTDPKFKNWLRLRDIYSNQVRQDMLNTAHASADAARVVAFFKGFLESEANTGSSVYQAAEPPPPNPAGPRQAALSLNDLAAPGHAKPASGTSAQPAEKLTITRQQIAKFHDNVRRGVYQGRDQDRLNDEAIIFAALKEGRVI